MGRAFRLSWVIGNALHGFSGHQNDPEWEEVAIRLHQARGNSGCVSLAHRDVPEIGAESIELRTDGSLHLVTLLEATDTETVVRTIP